jgi:hypothetical protein
LIFFDRKAPLINAYVTNAWVAKFWKQPLLEKSSKSGMSRKADIGVECSEGLLPAISTSGGVAASYGSGYALKVMREHMVKVWEE